MYRNAVLSVSTVLMFTGGVAATGCDEPDEDVQQQGEQADEQQADEQQADEQQADEQQADEQTAAEPDDERAEEVLGILADELEAYKEGDQQWTPPDGAEPWHDASESEEPPGMPVGFADKVFPGGTGVKLEFAPDVPEGGETVETDVALLEHDADVDADSVLGQLTDPTGDEDPFRYVYKTGPDSGEDATATLRAEANLDPETPEYHTVVKELGFSEDDWVTRSDIVVENEGH